MTQVLRSKGITVALTFGLLLVVGAGCTGEGTYRLHLTFAEDAPRESVKTVYFFAVEWGRDSCDKWMRAQLSLEGINVFSRLVVELPAAGEHRFRQVPARELLFLAEGRDEKDAPLLRGCTTANVRPGATVEVTVELKLFCAPQPGMEGPAGAPSCANGLDDDCDGLTDGNDPGCNPCVGDQECGDDNPCTTDRCNETNGHCEYTYTPRPGLEGSQKPGSCTNLIDDDCDGLTDGNDPGCNLCVRDQECSDDNPCTTDRCNETNGHCEYTYTPRPGLEGPQKPGSCTNLIDDDCDGVTDGADPDCVSCGSDAECADENACTVDRCTEGHCENTPVEDGTGCDDGDPCTLGDDCATGVCSAGTGRKDSDQDGYVDLHCPYGDDCDDGQAEVNPGAAEGPFGDATCTDGLDNDCDTLTDERDTACLLCTTDPECDDHTVCTSDRCAGVRCENTSLPETACDDLLFCNGLDTCDGSGRCGAHAGDPCPATDQRCDEANQRCVDCLADGDCEDGLLCTDDRCLMETGTCVNTANDGLCDDGLFCTGAERCDAGAPVHDPVTGCVSSGGPCAGGAECNRACNEALDNCFDAIGTSCGDGAATACTRPDNCDGGGFCLSNHSAPGTACDDLVFCNGLDACDDSGSCSAHAGNPCDTFACDELLEQCTVGMVVVNAGTFSMGSPGTEEGRYSNEVQHDVTLTHDFSLSSTELTQADFLAVMGWNPSYFGSCADCPVEQVSWYDALAYLNESTLQQGGTPCYVLANVACKDASNVGANYMGCMNAVQGGINAATVGLNGVTSVYDCTGFRLPTEAEWEYAARAGDTRATYNGDLDAAHLNCEQPNAVLDPIAWFCGNAVGATHVKGDRLPNAWGLYDMVGNVWEWCHDWYGSYVAGPVSDPEGPVTGSSRVARGGGWLSNASYARTASRGNGVPGSRRDLGLRAARTLEP